MKNNKQDKIETKQSKPKQISIFTLLLAVILIAVALGIYFGVRYLVITLKYKEYTNKMKTYSYSELYENKKATAIESVTNKEAIKVVIGSILNNKKIENLYYLYDETISEDRNWYNYANYLNIDNITKLSDLDSKAKKIDVILFSVDVLESIKDTEIEKAELKMSEGKLNKFTEQEKELIAKAVSIGIIQNKNSALSDKNILKGELNKIVISIVEKFVTMQNFSTNANIVTDKKNMPQNYEEYPYILDNIQKAVYEMDYQILSERTYKSPKETFKVMGYLYGQIQDLVVRYFNKILNVDYTNLTSENFLNSIKNDVVYMLEEKDVITYVNYVIQNKIKLEGSATPLLPIMYNNGEQFVVRTRITFKVLNSETQNNLLFGDENSNVKYSSKNVDMYVDVPLGTTLNSDSQRIYISTLANHISNSSSMVTVEK